MPFILSELDLKPLRQPSGEADLEWEGPNTKGARTLIFPQLDPLLFKIIVWLTEYARHNIITDRCDCDPLLGVWGDQTEGEDSSEDLWSYWGTVAS